MRVLFSEECYPEEELPGGQFAFSGRNASALLSALFLCMASRLGSLGSSRQALVLDLAWEDARRSGC